MSKDQPQRPPAPTISIHQDGYATKASSDQALGARIDNEVGNAFDLGRKVAEIMRSEGIDPSEYAILTCIGVIPKEDAHKLGIRGIFLPVDGPARTAYVGEVIE